MVDEAGGGMDVRDKAMTMPVLMAVDDDAESPGTLDATLRLRYGRDYLVISDASAAAALGRRLRGERRPVHAAAGARGLRRAVRQQLGFILTGSDLPDRRNPAASPAPSRSLETSLPGVFAAGDVRHGSIKRVASAVGEGSIATTQMTQYLQDQTGNS
jgi:hypothetical protein